MDFMEGMEVYERLGHVIDALRALTASSAGVESRFLRHSDNSSETRNENVTCYNTMRPKSLRRSPCACSEKNSRCCTSNYGHYSFSLLLNL